MKRKVGYVWRLREVMAQHQIFTATELVPLLHERGIDLSASQVHRLVSGTPERLSLQVLSAFCDILGCTPALRPARPVRRPLARRARLPHLPRPDTAPARRCPGCGTDRVLPGLRPGDGAAICPDCAGFSMSYACSRCGHEGKLHGGRRCTRCTLADRLGELLDDGTGRIHPRLVPLAQHLLAMGNPMSGLVWLIAPPQPGPGPTA